MTAIACHSPLPICSTAKLTVTTACSLQCRGKSFARLRVHLCTLAHIECMFSCLHNAETHCRNRVRAADRMFNQHCTSLLVAMLAPHKPHFSCEQLLITHSRIFAEDMAGVLTSPVLSLLHFFDGAATQQPQFVNELSSSTRQSLRARLCC